MANTMQDLIDSAIDELKEYIQENGPRQADDRIAEIADSSVPIYTYDLLMLAVTEPYLAQQESDIGPAFDGRPTALNIIAAVVYEELQNALYQYLNDHDFEQCDKCGEYFDDDHMQECDNCGADLCDDCFAEHEDEPEEEDVEVEEDADES